MCKVFESIYRVINEELHVVNLWSIRLDPDRRRTNGQAVRRGPSRAAAAMPSLAMKKKFVSLLQLCLRRRS